MRLTVHSYLGVSHIEHWDLHPSEHAQDSVD